MAELQRPSTFKRRHFSPEVILCAVRWYLRYSLSYRDVQEPWRIPSRRPEAAHTINGTRSSDPDGVERSER